MGKSKTSQIGSILIFLLLLTVSTTFAQIPCDHLITKDTDIIDGQELGIESGDVVCLEAGAKPYLLIRNIDPADTFTEKVLITNKDGSLIIATEHYFGISIQNCNNIKLSGKGVSGIDYGIHIRRVENGSGLGINNFSSKVEVEGLEIENTFFAGIIAKTDPYCQNGEIMATRDDFTQFDIIVHDNYIHDTGGEGMYIGSSKFTGFTLECNGSTHTVLPHVNIGVQIYDNIVERTGWDAIQVSSVTYDCNIYNNFISHDSEEGYPSQMSGILIGGGSECDCYNNQIFDGKGDGIEALGAGNQKIYNNLIVRPGQTYEPGDLTKSKHGIYNDHIYTGSNAYLYFYNNTIISPKSYGITFRNDHLSNIRAYNNIIIDPGAYDIDGEAAYLNIESSNISVDKKSNFLSQNVYNVKFDSPANDDYDLQISSPAINAGESIPEISFDILNRTRPYANEWDIGAFECHKPGAGITDPEKQIQSSEIYPNPFTHTLSLHLGLKNRTLMQCEIRNVFGEVMAVSESPGKLAEKTFRFNTSSWSSGVYFYKIIFSTGRITGKVIKQ